MEVDFSVYQVFYRKLCRIVIKKAYNGIKPKNLRTETGKLLWNTFSKQEFIKYFPSDGTVNRYYFYNNQRDALKKENPEIDDRILVSAFRYISMPTEVMKRLNAHPGIRDKAHYLCEEFKKLNRNEIEENRADAHSKKTPRKQNILSEQDIIKLTESPENIDDLDLKKERSPHFLSISMIVRSYFGSIENGNFGLAWNLLSSEAKRRLWDSDFYLFMDHQLPDITIFKISNHHLGFKSDSVICDVVLRCTLPPREFRELQEFNFRKYTVENLESFVDEVNSLKKLVDALEKNSEGDLSLDEMPLSDLFKSGYFMYDKDMSAKDFLYILPYKDIGFVFCRITSVFDGDWKIKSIDKNLSAIRKLKRNR